MFGDEESSTEGGPFGALLENAPPAEIHTPVDDLAKQAAPWLRDIKASIIAPMAESLDVSNDSKETANLVDEDEVDLGDEARNAKTAEEKYEALKRRFQMDLNSPGQIEQTGLENPALIFHTAKCRAELARLEKEASELPTEEFVLQEETSSRRALSSFVTTLEELQQQIDCESATLHGVSNKLNRVIGAPAASDDRRELMAIQKIIDASSSQLGTLSADVRKAQIILTTARRSCEAALDGMKARASHYKAASDNTLQ